MLGFSDEFTLPEHITMDEVKRRVALWQMSPLGNEYVLEVKHERHVILTKTKHDLKVCCCYPCAILLIGIVVIMMLPLYSMMAAMTAVFGFIVLLVITMIVSYAWFFLNPKRAKYTLIFSNEFPIRVRVHAEGEINQSAHEYRGLKDTLLGGRPEPGPGLTY